MKSMKTAALAAMAILPIVAYMNCMGPIHEGNFSSSSSYSSSGCEGPLVEAYKVTFHPFLQRQCASCHVAGPGIGTFASASVGTSFPSFKVLTRTKIENMAKNDGHKPPYTGAQHTSEVNQLSALYVQAEKIAIACEQKANPDSNMLLNGLVAAAVPTTYKKLTWDLTSNLDPLEGMAGFAGRFEVNVRFAVLGPNTIGYEFQNPTLISNAGGKPLAVNGLRLYFNGEKADSFTYYLTAAGAVAAGASLNLAPVGTSVHFTTTAATDKIAFELINIRDTSSGSSGGGTPTPTPSGTPINVTFTQLNAAGGVFQRSCVGCHNAGNMAGALDLTNYNSARQRVVPGNANASAIYTRMTNTGNPMPPAGLLGPADIATVQAWINNGAPQ